MGTIRVKKSPAIRSQILDDLKSCHRTLRDDLLSMGDCCDLSVGVPIHRHALPDQKQTAKHRQRQQYPQNRASQINPEVAELRRLMA